MITDFEEIRSDLEFPFEPESISWRVGSTNKRARQRQTGDDNATATKGVALAYVDARDVMDRLDAVCGGDWQCDYPVHYGGLLICRIGIKIGGDWVWRSNGAGSTDIEAEKGQASDAFKRAAVLWGVGRYLYSLPADWVDLDDRGYNLAKTPSLPEWATPEGWQGGRVGKRVELQPLMAMNARVREHMDSIGNIMALLDAIGVELDPSQGYAPKRELTDQESNDLLLAQECWQAIPEHDQRAMWIAPTKGGIFTTEQRALLKL